MLSSRLEQLKLAKQKAVQSTTPPTIPEVVEDLFSSDEESNKISAHEDDSEESEEDKDEEDSDKEDGS